MFPTRYSLPLTGLDWLEYYAAHKVYHPGVDFNWGSGFDDYGQNVVAVKEGVVEFVEPRDNTFYNRGFGKFVILSHNDGNYTRYAHLSDIGADIIAGHHVKEGDLVGHLGNTGTSSPHLHFEIFNSKMADRQKAHTVAALKRPWCYYPSSQTKQFIIEHYINPWEYLKESEFDKEKKIAIEWCKKNELITVFGAPMTDERLAIILKRLVDKFNNLI